MTCMGVMDADSDALLNNSSVRFSAFFEAGTIGHRAAEEKNGVRKGGYGFWMGVRNRKS